MRKGMIFSALLHAMVLALAVFGLPDFGKKIDVLDQPIPVEIVDISELTNAPPPDVEQKVREEAKRDDPKPDPNRVPPPPEPEEPQVAAPVAPPKPKEVAKKPEPKPEPKPKPKEIAKKPELKPEKLEEEKPVQQARATSKPKRRPKPPKPSFDSVLKTVEDIRKKKQSPDSEQPRKQTASARNARNIPDQPLTISEIDAIRRQFIRCWNVDPGLKGIEGMVVSVRVNLNPDRTVRAAQILDRVDPGNPYYRSFAESALRAVHSSKCSPVRLPPKKFEMMRTFTLRFSAKEMLGL